MSDILSGSRHRHHLQMLGQRVLLSQTARPQQLERRTAHFGSQFQRDLSPSKKKRQEHVVAIAEEAACDRALHMTAIWEMGGKLESRVNITFKDLLPVTHFHQTGPTSERLHSLQKSATSGDQACPKHVLFGGHVPDLNNSRHYPTRERVHLLPKLTMLTVNFLVY